MGYVQQLAKHFFLDSPTLTKTARFPVFRKASRPGHARAPCMAREKNARQRRLLQKMCAGFLQTTSMKQLLKHVKPCEKQNGKPGDLLVVGTVTAAATKWHIPAELIYLWR
jgi:hypothetical protein